MRTTVNINNNMLLWAIARAGFELHEFTEKLPQVKEWMEGKRKPTVRQLEVFSKKVYLPFGYLFLQQPPEERLPIPFFRTGNNSNRTVDLNVYDTVLLIQRRQEWLKDYLTDNEFKPIPFVGKYSNSQSIEKIVNDKIGRASCRERV